MLDWTVFIPVVPMMRVAYHIAASGCQGALAGQHSAQLPHGSQRRATRNRLVQKLARFRRMWRPSIRWTTLSRARMATSCQFQLPTITMEVAMLPFHCVPS